MHLASSPGRPNRRWWCALLHGAGILLIGTIQGEPMQFTEVTGPAQINHVHSHSAATKARSSHDNIFAEYVRMTGGAVAEDFDGDGWPDLYVLQGGASANLLYINNRDGTFREEAALWGADLIGLHVGVAAADYDGDGDIDLIVSSGDATHHLLTNTGADSLMATTLAAPAGKATSPSWGDIDGDGLLDLALGSWNLEFAEKLHIYRNNGLGQLIGHQEFVQHYAFTPRFADIDGDRDQDLLVAADFGAAAIFTNDGTGLFTPFGTSDVENGMGAAVGDIDNDGDLDWFISSIRDFDGAQANWGTTGNRLHRNDGFGIFSDITGSAGVRDGFWGWGSAMADFDNDGDLDIYHVNGWPETRLDSADEFDDKPALLFENLGNNQFLEVAGTSGDAAHRGQGRAVVVFDYDQDGDLDIFIANNLSVNLSDPENPVEEPGLPVLLRNDLGDQKAWLKVHLDGREAPHHRHGIGSRVYVTSGGITQLRELNASSGYLGHGPERIAHFGLGDETQVTEIRAVWTNGDETRVKGTGVNREITLTSPQASLSSRNLLPGEAVEAEIDLEHFPEGTTATWTVQGQTYPNPVRVVPTSEGEVQLRLDVYDDTPEPQLLRTEILTVTVDSGDLPYSIARMWNEENLAAIRIDFPNPTAHARNLFHTAAAMWDAWAAYDATAVGYVHREKASAADVASARAEAISYAAYRVLRFRYENSVNGSTTVLSLNNLMSVLGYDPAVITTEGYTPAALGNRVAAAILEFASTDGAYDVAGYLDGAYAPVNDPLPVAEPGTSLNDPNRWQPLLFEVAETQNGQVADVIQTFLGAHWGAVRPFALDREPGEALFIDPGVPPQLGGTGDLDFKQGNVEVILYSSLLDPDDGISIDISPGAFGNNTLGENDGVGHPINPHTGAPYPPNVVNHADFGRILAEFWADGPDSETPPGHWNVLANEVSYDPDFDRRFGGEGDVLDPLEWDVKLYFALNGALHDSAVAAWACKRVYDFVRPITSIRHLGGLGQSSDPGQPGYHPNGLPLVPGLIEVITAESAAAGQRHAHLAAHLGRVTIRSWELGSGVTWILPETWMPYQRATFVTPAFAGFVSGHSTFSRAAAEVMTRLTGSEFFPGGMATFTARANQFLEFEEGPSSDVVLQWATYYDAADQAGISRLYGGIHVPVDDGPGRIMGSQCGIQAWNLAVKYFDGSIGGVPVYPQFRSGGGATFHLSWNRLRGFYYRVLSSPDLVHFTELDPWRRAESSRGEMEIVLPGTTEAHFFGVERSPLLP